MGIYLSLNQMGRRNTIPLPAVIVTASMSFDQEAVKQEVGAGTVGNHIVEKSNVGRVYHLKKSLRSWKVG